MYKELLEPLLQLQQQAAQNFENADKEHVEAANEALLLTQSILDSYVKLRRLWNNER